MSMASSHDPLNVNLVLLPQGATVVRILSIKQGPVFPKNLKTIALLRRGLNGYSQSNSRLFSCSLGVLRR